MVSGTISLPSRGTFHHSLTVLVRYRSSRSIQAYRVVPADSQQIPRARCYSGNHCKAGIGFSRTGLSPSTADHPRPLPLTTTLSHCPPGKVDPDTTLPQPRTHNPYPVSHAYGLAILRFRSPLLTESQLFSLPTGTEMFHFPALPPHRLYIHRRVTRHHSCRVSPFGHPRIHARLTAPRGISQPPTSFIGSRCQGIHHAPLNTYKHKNQKTKIAKTNRPTGLLARCSQPLSTKQTPHPTTKMERQQHPPPQGAKNGPVASGPNSVPRTNPANATPEEATLVDDLEKFVAAQKISAPPTTHYRRRRKLSQPSDPTGVGTGEKWCSLERR